MFGKCVFLVRRWLLEKGRVETDITVKVVCFPVLYCDDTVVWHDFVTAHPLFNKSKLA